MLNHPNNLSESTLQWGLDTLWIGRRIIHKQTTSSTQTIAHQLAKENAEHGTVVIANEQTKGKGRMGKTFYSTKNKGIWMSMILRPKTLPSRAPHLTLLTATVLADVISTHIGIRPQIKWPNDILINGKKIAGILTEMQVNQNQIQYVVIGIGLNVLQNHDDIHKSIRHKATSLQIETKEEWHFKEIFQEILRIFEKRYKDYIENGFSSIKNKWESYGYKIGEKIYIQTLKDTWQATFLGINDDGALLTKTNNGEIDKIYSAKIDWFKEDL